MAIFYGVIQGRSGVGNDFVIFIFIFLILFLRIIHVIHRWNGNGIFLRRPDFVPAFYIFRVLFQLFFVFVFVFVLFPMPIPVLVFFVLQNARRVIHIHIISCQ